MKKTLYKRPIRLILMLFCGILSSVGFWSLAESGNVFRGKPESHTIKRTLVIGKVTDNPKKHFKTLRPMVEYAVKHMKDLGITDGKVLMARDNEQMIRYLKQGRVDWVTETVFSAIIFEERAEAEILLRKWKKGVPEYHTIFFTRKDSGVNSLNDLKSRTIVFEDPGSTSAYFTPAIIILREGLDLIQLKSFRENPPKDKVGYVFSRQEINTSTWVFQGLVDVGAFNNLDWNKDDHMRTSYKKDMKIIYKTKPYPRAVELVRKDLNPGLKQRLRKTLLTAHNDPQAKMALRDYQKTIKFDELDDTALTGLDEVRQLSKFVQSRIQ